MDGIDSSNRSGSAARAASEQEREASRRINESRRQVKEAQFEADREIEHVRNASEKVVAAESARADASVENQKSRGFEAVRSMRNQQQKELSRMQREGENELKRLDSHYRNSTYDARRKGEAEIDEAHRTQSQQAAYAQRLGQAEVEAIRARSHDEINRERAESTARITSLQAANRAELERKQLASEEASVQSDERYRERFSEIQKIQNKTLGDTYERASQGIRQVRAETAHKLAAYRSRQSDPFYQVVELDADLRESADRYVLRATIPPHEQKHISVSLKGENIVVSGFRRNEEKQELEPGKTRATASFQSFHESFPLDNPVEAKQLTRRFEGDQLIIEVPKKREYQLAKPYQGKPTPERARLEKPKFPDNLPYTDRDVDARQASDTSVDELPEGPPPTSTKRSTRTLG